MKRNKLFKVLVGGVIASFILVLCFAFTGVAFAAEETTVAATEAGEAVKKVQTAIDWIKSLSIDDLKGWLAGIIAYLSANLLVIIFLVIKLVLNSVKKYQESEEHNKVIEKMNAEQKKQEAECLNAVTKKLDELALKVEQSIVASDEKKKTEAAANIEVLKKSLDEIKVEIEK